MAVSGAPERSFEHAENVANLALCLVQQVRKLNLPGEISEIRIGLLGFRLRFI